MKLETKRKLKKIPRFFADAINRGHAKIGLIYSFEGEAVAIKKLFKKKLIKRKEKFVTNWATYERGWLDNGNEVIISQCGMGKTNASVLAFDMIQRFNPDVVILTGSCGGNVLQGVKPLDIIVADTIEIYDANIPGCEESTKCGRKNLDVSWFFDYGEKNTKPVTMEDAHFGKIGEGTSIKRGMLMSGDKFTTYDDIKFLNEKFADKEKGIRPLACDMESGSVAIVCETLGVPFICFKIVADCPDENGSHDDKISEFLLFWNKEQNSFTEFTGKVLNLIHRSKVSFKSSSVVGGS